MKTNVPRAMAIDDAPLNSFHLRVATYTTGGYFVDGYILGMIGIAAAISRISAAIGTFLLPASVEQFGTGPTMLGATAILVLGAVLSVAWAPETRHVTLSEASMAATKPAGQRRKPPRPWPGG